MVDDFFQINCFVSPDYGFDKTITHSRYTARNMVNILAIFPVIGQFIGGGRLICAKNTQQFLRGVVELFCGGVLCVMVDIFVSTFQKEKKQREDQEPRREEKKTFIIVGQKYADESEYVGEMKEGQKNGVGRLSLPDGSYDEGFFEKDTFVKGRSFNSKTNCLLEDELLTEEETSRLNQILGSFPEVQK